MSEKQTETTTEPQNGQAMQQAEGRKAAKAPATTIGAYLRDRQMALSQVCPPGVKVEKVINTVAVLVASAPEPKPGKPSLRECTFESVFLAAMQGCELGLSFNPALGQGYLIPYAGRAEFRPGYRGLVKLAKEDGGVRDIEAHVVRVGDDFDYALGLNPRLDHCPAIEGIPGEVTAAYAIAWMPSGRVMLEVMTRAEIDHIRDKHAASGSMMWKDHFDEAARKTVLRRLCKHIPAGERLGDALAADNEVEITEAETAPAKVESLKARLAAKAGE
jgi:recombination protein RecT